MWKLFWSIQVTATYAVSEVQKLHLPLVREIAPSPAHEEALLHASSTTQHSPAALIVRDAKSQDATRNSTAPFLLEPLLSREKSAALSDLATTLQKSVGNLKLAYHSQYVRLFSGMLSILAGCVVALLISKLDVLTYMEVYSLNGCAARLLDESSMHLGVDLPSDGESDSDETEGPFAFNIRTLSSVSKPPTRKTGLLWKLERRHTDDLKNHRGSELDSFDRFAYLESWDLRFFSLDIEQDTLILSYVSELSKFSRVMLEVKSIDPQIIRLPRLLDGSSNKKKGKGTITDFYRDYIEKLRGFGYELPKSDTRDPSTLYVIVVNGIRKGEVDGSRALGRLRWRSDQTNAENDPAFSSMCLASNRSSDAKRWHSEIVRQLSTGGQIEKDFKEKRAAEDSSSDKELDRQSSSKLDRQSSFVTDAEIAQRRTSPIATLKPN